MELDFILHSPGIVIHDFQMPPVTFSDHLPLVCNFEIQK
jgi:endonuclease/exonuclease/phosphatase (EEP) superfamily protein YafD